MSPETTTTNPEGVAQGVQLIARWAELTGVLALYPDTNIRVARALRGLREALHAACEEQTTSILYGKDLLVVGDARIQIKRGTKVHWLKERFDSGVLAGIHVDRDVPDDSLTAFTRVLIDAYARRSRTRRGFAEVWASEYEGLEPVERRFEGGFGPGGEGDPGPALPTRNRSRLSAKLAERVRQDPEVIRALETLDSDIARQAAPAEEVESIDILEEIAGLLPADVVSNEERVLEVTRATLAELIGRERSAEEQLLSLASQVGRGFFRRVDAREEAEVEEVAEEEPAEKKEEPRATPRSEKRERRPEDDLIEEDFEELERELERLGPPTTSVSREDVDFASEQLGVYLQELSCLDDPGELPGLEHGLSRLLRDPDGARLEVLKQFLLADEGISADARARLLAYLRRRRATHLIRLSGALDFDWALREFPEDFFDFVGMLDLDTEEDCETLRELSEWIGPRRIEEAEPILRRDARLNEKAFTRCIFESNAEAFLPFARILVGGGGESYKNQLRSYLRETTGSELDRELLDVVERGSWLSSEYLSLLAKGEETERLNYQRQAILCRFLRETEEKEEKEGLLERRVRAVKLLVHFPTVAVERVLERIVKERRMLFKYAAPRELRQAARSVLRDFKESSLELGDV